jgi:predicted DNA-binding transcriptional regulator AlpA
MNDELINERQVAKKLSVSLAALRRWRVEHRGPPYRKLAGGSAVRYSVEDLQHWIDSQPRGGQQEIPA